MSTYNYHIRTTNSEAAGSIQAASEDEARNALTAQYVPEDHGFVDEDGKPVKHELISLDLKIA